jgi:hypothetical protein
MRKVNEHLETLANNLVALFAANACDQAHAAGIMLIPRVIETLRRGNVELGIRWMHGVLLK